MHLNSARFACGVTALALACGSAGHAQTTPVAPPPSGAAADPQSGAPFQTPSPSAPIGAANQLPDDQKEIIVTGTSIRGAPPVGSNLISVGRAAIEDTGAQSVQQILKTVPAVVGMGSAGQGSFGSADGSGTNAPTIHGLGGSASNSTLVLIDGHRFPLSGINHALGDPNIVPTIAIERVEVLPDGASAVYGSDAVAGVINFITRTRYDGIEGSSQVGFADQYRTYNGSLLAGKTWDTGSLLVAYGFSKRDNLLAGDRAFTRANHTAQGGGNLASFACAPASIQPTGSTLIYASPYTGAGIANAQANAFCDYSGVSDLLPSELRHNLMVKGRQEITDRLTVTGDIVYSNRKNRQQVQRGSVTASVFNALSGRGTQINPFYVGVPGSTATSETVRFQADDLLGPGAYILGKAEDFYVHGSAEYRLDDNFRITLGGVFGIDNSLQQNVGQLCVSCAYLALNGTTNGAGSLTTASVPSTGLIVTQPLTAANALDVWNAAGTNRTSAAVRALLTDSTQTQAARQTIKDATLKIDGALFHLPAGDVKIAVGGEFIEYTLKQDITRPLNIGPATTGSATVNLYYHRQVYSGYVEALFPIVSPEMDIPLVHAFDINLSGRYDHYDDFGSTKNPKIAANWEVIEGVKLRGNFARSFVAPALTSRGSNQFGVTGESGYSSYAQGQVNVPVASFPSAVGLPGCPAGSTTCALGTSTVTGILLAGGNAALKPQRGTTYSFGGDFAPRFLPGVRLGVTYWYNRIRGGITAPQPSLAIGAADLSSLLQIYPTGASAAQLSAASAGLPQTGALPATTYFIYDFRQRNVLNLDVSGLDVDISYVLTTATAGKFTFGAAFTDELKFDQRIGNGATFSVLNTTGFNTTFPSIRFQGRANLGWEMGPFSADAFLNHTGSYRNYSSTTVNPIVRSAAGVPIGGGDKVKSYDTIDLHIAYKIPQTFMKKAQVFVDVTNLFDKDPPFYNSYTVNGTSGYDSFGGNPIGRLVTVGVRAAF